MKKLLAFLFVAALIFFATSLFAANAVPTAVSSISVSGSTGTVNSTAHGIAVNRGFCLSGQTYCGVALSSSANSFTFNFTAANPAVACVSACGTVSPAKSIIALQISSPPNQSAAFVCWLFTTSPVAGSSKSQWSGASTAENNAIAAGNIIEVSPQQFPVAGATLASFKAYAQNSCGGYQSQLDSGIPPAFVLGNFFDGTGWLN